MSSLYSRSGVFYVQYFREGRKVQRSLETRSLAVARDKQRQIDRQLRAEKAASADSADTDTVAQLLDAYKLHAEQYYRKDGQTTSQITVVNSVIAACEPYRAMSAAAIGPGTLKSIMAGWADAGLARTTINKYRGQLVRIWKWGVSEDRVPVQTYQALVTVEGLRAGRSDAREPEPVKPVLEKHVQKTREKLPLTLQAVVDLQLLTAARPGELLGLRPCDIDRSGAVWTANVRHKMEHTGRERRIYLGPKAQAVIRPFLLDRGPADYLFRPADAAKQRHAKAKSPRRAGQKPNPRKTARVVGPRYTTRAYRDAIGRACEAAKVPVWHPHQLRHNAGTAIRKEFGLEASQVFLGHSNANVTQVYAERDAEKAIEIARLRG